MAVQPCRVCRTRFRGPASRAYVAILSAGERWEFKPRLCPGCYSALRDLFVQVNGLIIYDRDEDYEQQPCLVCQKDPDGKHPHSIFMTGYPAGSEREDFFAPVCQPCRPAAELLLREPAGGFQSVLRSA